MCVCVCVCVCACACVVDGCVVDGWVYTGKQVWVSRDRHTTYRAIVGRQDSIIKNVQ